jgi:hypothetical protein
MPIFVPEKDETLTRLVRRALLILQAERQFFPTRISAFCGSHLLPTADVTNFVAVRDAGADGEIVYRTSLDPLRLGLIQEYLRQHLDVLATKLPDQDDRDLIYAAAHLAWNAEQYIYLFFQSIGAMTAETKKEILERCGGRYYLLRYDVQSDDIVCSTLMNYQEDVPNNAPRFTNVLSEIRPERGSMQKGEKKRTAHGHIIQLGSTYAFLGFVEGHENYRHVSELRSWAGMKVIFFHADRGGLNGKVGIFMSLIGANTYHFGHIKAVKARGEEPTREPLIEPGVYPFDDIAAKIEKRTGEKISRDEFGGRSVARALD